MKPLLIAVSLLLPLAGVEAAPPTVAIGHPYSYATAAPGVPGVGFLSLTAKADDRLVAIESSKVGQIELHQSQTRNGVMQMRAVSDGLKLPAGKTITLAPNGLHLMLFGLSEPLVVGMHLPLTLRFEKAGVVHTELVVEPREEEGPRTAEPHHH